MKRKLKDEFISSSLGDHKPEIDTKASVKFYEQAWENTYSYEELEYPSGHDFKIKKIVLSRQHASLIKTLKMRLDAAEVTGDYSKALENYDNAKKAFAQLFRKAEAAPHIITLKDERNFRMGFFLGNDLGIGQRKEAWKQAKVYDGTMGYAGAGFVEERKREGSLRPQENGFVKGFIRSQHRSAFIKLTDIQLNGVEVTGNNSRRKEILQRYGKVFEMDRHRAFKKYCKEKWILEVSRRGYSDLLSNVITKVNSPYKKDKEMKIRTKNRGAM